LICRGAFLANAAREFRNPTSAIADTSNVRLTAADGGEAGSDTILGTLGEGTQLGAGEGSEAGDAGNDGELHFDETGWYRIGSWRSDRGFDANDCKQGDGDGGSVRLKTEKATTYGRMLNRP